MIRSVALRVINVFLKKFDVLSTCRSTVRGLERTHGAEVDSESFVGDFKLARRVAVREKAQSHAKVDDRLLRHLAEASDVHCLGVIAEPVAKVPTQASESVPENMVENYVSSVHSLDCNFTPRM